MPEPTMIDLADALDAERKARREAEAELRASDREEMPRLMSDLSEQHWCASWLNTTDTDLWGMIHEGRKREWGMDIVSDEALARLRVLSERLGEWYDGGEFIPLDKWKAQRSLARASGEGKAEPSVPACTVCGHGLPAPGACCPECHEDYTPHREEESDADSTR